MGSAIITGRLRRTDSPVYAKYVLRNLVEQAFARGLSVQQVMANYHVSYAYVYDLKHQHDPGYALAKRQYLKRRKQQAQQELERSA